MNTVSKGGYSRLVHLFVHRAFRRPGFQMFEVAAEIDAAARHVLEVAVHFVFLLEDEMLRFFLIGNWLKSLF